MPATQFTIGYSTRKIGGYEICSFFFTYSSVVFNGIGKTGEPRFPAAPEGEGWCAESRENIVAYAKRLLKQRWSPAPVAHELKVKCWHKLPARVWALSRKVAYGA